MDVVKLRKSINNMIRANYLIPEANDSNADEPVYILNYQLLDDELGGAIISGLVAAKTSSSAAAIIELLFKNYKDISVSKEEIF